MKRLLFAAACALFCNTVAFAECEYNDPQGDAQYTKCVTKYKSDSNYTGADSPSKQCGLTNVEAFCRCAWNETPSESKDLHKALEGAGSEKLVKLCEKWSGWK